jgi:aryl-alcohol dehydrogenase-like predicted oxidoreductase
VAGFVLGTAQLGAAYGRTNATGHLSDEAAAELLEAAYASGVREIDTARAYGESERRIGDFARRRGISDLVISTKLSPLLELAPDAETADVVSAVRHSLQESLRLLNVEQLPVLMLHRPGHCEAFGGAVMEELRRWRERGVIGTLGASVNTPQELLGISGQPDIRHVQLPFNLLDGRWRAALPAAADGHTFHVRSIFLQGLLANPQSAAWPVLPGYDPIETVRALEQVARRLGRQGVRELAVAYVRGQPWIGGCVIGLERPEQLEENLRLFSQAPLTAAETAVLRDLLPGVPASLVEPWTWPPVKPE